MITKKKMSKSTQKDTLKLMKQIKDIFRKRMHVLNLSQSDVAHRLNCSRQNVNAMFREVTIFTIPQMREICKSLEMDFSILFTPNGETDGTKVENK